VFSYKPSIYDKIVNDTNIIREDNNTCGITNLSSHSYYADIERGQNGIFYEGCLIVPPMY